MNHAQPEQMDLFAMPRQIPRKKIAYQHTSRQAYASMAGSQVSGDLDKLILAAIRKAMPQGITCEAIERAIGRNHQSVSGNLRHICERGIVKNSGRKGKTSSGRAAILWVLA